MTLPSHVNEGLVRGESSFVEKKGGREDNSLPWFGAYGVGVGSGGGGLPRLEDWVHEGRWEKGDVDNICGWG